MAAGYDAGRRLSSGAQRLRDISLEYTEDELATATLNWAQSRRLGSGSFGEGFKAKVAATGRLVAVKRVLKQRDSTMKEFMILRSLDHPHVLRVNGHFEDEQSLYVVSEFLSGGSVADLLQQQSTPFTEAWAATVIGQTLVAMAYCHREDVVHNDLKPENLLLKGPLAGGGPHIVVSDFGQASPALQDGQCQDPWMIVFSS